MNNDKIKTPKVRSPYAYDNTDKNIIFYGALLAIVLLLVSGIFSLPLLYSIAQALIAAVITFVIGTTLRVAVHTNRRVVDLAARIERDERPVHGVEQP